MHVINRNKWTLIATLLLILVTIYVASQRPEFTIGGELFLPVFPALIKGLIVTGFEFKEELK